MALVLDFFFLLLLVVLLRRRRRYRRWLDEVEQVLEEVLIAGKKLIAPPPSKASKSAGGRTQVYSPDRFGFLTPWKELGRDQVQAEILDRQVGELRSVIKKLSSQYKGTSVAGHESTVPDGELQFTHQKSEG